MTDNYSYQTSLPAYHAEQNEKKKQAFVIFEKIRQGADNLLLLSEIVGLPQSTVSGRISDLKQEGRVIYEGHVTYKGYKRKRLQAVVKEGEQINLFQ